MPDVVSVVLLRTDESHGAPKICKPIDADLPLARVLSRGLVIANLPGE